MILNEIQNEDEYEKAVVFKLRQPEFTSDEAEQRLEKKCLLLLDKIVRVGKGLVLEPKERNEKLTIFQKLVELPENQRKSVLSKARKIPFFQSDDTSGVSKRFYETLKLKLYSFLYADLVNKPLRLSRDHEQQHGNGRFAKYGMNYDEFFVIDDILCILGITEQFVPVDGQMTEEKLQTRIWLTNYGRSLLQNQQNSIINYKESGKEFREVIMNKTIKRKVQNKTTGRLKNENISVPVSYFRSGKVNRIIKRVERINRIYDDQKLMVKSNDIEISVKEMNKLLVNHIDGKIKIHKLFYSFNICNTNKHLLNTRIINIINTNSHSYSNCTPILQEGDTTGVDRPGGGIKGDNSILYRYNNDITCQHTKDISCKYDSSNVVIKSIEFEILDKDIHRVFSRECWSLHGRHYAYQNTMKKILRSGVYLNNNTVPMVGLDFSAMHWTFAYHLSLLPCNSESIYIISGYDRDLVKDIALVAMNVKRSKGKRPYQGALQAIRDNVCIKHGVTYTEAKKAFYAFMEKHNDIENYMCSDFGIKGMYYDSLIMDDCLYQLMIIGGIIILPVHDELLCPVDKVEIVKEQMIQSYRKIMKDVLIKKKKQDINKFLPDQIYPSIKKD